jgi:serine/threonine protein kinase
MRVHLPRPPHLHHRNPQPARGGAGHPPFRDKNRRELYRKILSAKLTFPSFLSPAAVSLLRGLLDRNVEKRLGACR